MKKRKFKSVVSEMNHIIGRNQGLQTITVNRISERMGMKEKKKRK